MPSMHEVISRGHRIYGEDERPPELFICRRCGIEFRSNPETQAKRDEYRSWCKDCTSLDVIEKRRAAKAKRKGS